MAKARGLKRIPTHDRGREVRELVELALKWEPFGGPHAEEILTHFGLTKRQYHDRLSHVLDFYDHRQLNIAAEQHARLVQQCCNVETHRES